MKIIGEGFAIRPLGLEGGILVQRITCAHGIGFRAVQPTDKHLSLRGLERTGRQSNNRTGKDSCKLSRFACAAVRLNICRYSVDILCGEGSILTQRIACAGGIGLSAVRPTAEQLTFRQLEITDGKIILSAALGGFRDSLTFGFTGIKGNNVKRRLNQSCLATVLLNNPIRIAACKDCFGIRSVIQGIISGENTLRVSVNKDGVRRRKLARNRHLVAIVQINVVCHAVRRVVGEGRVAEDDKVLIIGFRIDRAANAGRGVAAECAAGDHDFGFAILRVLIYRDGAAVAVARCVVDDVAAVDVRLAAVADSDRRTAWFSFGVNVAGQRTAVHFEARNVPVTVQADGAVPIGQGSAIHIDGAVIADIHKIGISVSSKCAVAEQVQIVIIPVQNKETTGAGVSDRLAVQIHIDVLIAVRIPSVPVASHCDVVHQAVVAGLGRKTVCGRPSIVKHDG